MQTDLTSPNNTLTNLNEADEQYVGEPLRLQCTSWGAPLPRITWYKKQILNNTIGPIRKELFDEKNGHLTIISANDVSSLQINYLRLDDEGEYICNASSKVGSSMQSVNVTIKPTPPTKGLVFGAIAIIITLVVCACVAYISFKMRQYQKVRMHPQKSSFKKQHCIFHHTFS